MNNGEQFFNTAAGGYSISRSLRFSSADSSFLSRTPASAGDRRKWTFAAWVKRSELGRVQNIFRVVGALTDTTVFQVRFMGSDAIGVVNYSYFPLISTSVYRDTSAWYHIVVALDTTQATASNRLRFYINGSEVTAWATDSRASLAQNSDQGINQASVAHHIGGQGTNEYFSGYLADCFLIDSQALDPTAFGEFSATTGVWVPKAYSGGSYGTNGFHLDFADNSAATATTLGKDTSGAGNNWTPNNLSTNTGGPFSIAASTGGLPIWNTTDSYGATIGTGLRTDSNASSLALAVPLTTSGSNALTDDELPTGRTSSAKTLTASGSITSDSSVYRLYGSAALFSTNAYYALNDSAFNFGTADFTIECWVYLTESGSLVSTHLGSLSNTTLNVRIYGSGTMDVYTSGGSEYLSMGGAVPANVWSHVAISRSGGTMRVFVNGTLTGTNSSWGISISDSGNLYINRGRDGSGQRRIQDFRVYTGLAKYTTSFVVPTAAQNATIAAGNDSLVDVPTNGSEVDSGLGNQVRGNYATFNPLSQVSPALSNGNLDSTAGAAASSTIQLTSGKWYYEFTPSNMTSSQWVAVGVPVHSSNLANFAGYRPDSGQYYDGSGWIGYGATYTTSDVIGVAFDLSGNTIEFFKNGVSQGQKSRTFTVAVGPVVNLTGSVNFGQRSWAYQAPAGFKALCTANLPVVVTKASDLFDIVTYVGNGASTKTVSGLAFSPDLVWTKARSQAYGQNWYDIVRGGGKVLRSDITDAELTNSSEGYVSSFTSDGYVGTAGSNSAKNVNENGTSYVGWCWDAGNTTVTNTQGSISSQVRANASAGFSVVTFNTGSSGVKTVGHGLNVAPQFFVIKSRSSTGQWAAYHAAIGYDRYMLLHSTSAAISDSGQWVTSPTSSVFTFNSGYSTGTNVDYVGYFWTPVVGYSSMGSYVGNGSASDGPFVFCGFRPSVVILKRSNGAADWIIQDSKRPGYNTNTLYLKPNGSSEEIDSTGETNKNYIDFLSNGFKLRGSDLNTNAAQTYIYCAWAESPFAANNRAR